MLTLISPAKKLNVEGQLPGNIKPSSPQFLQQASELAEIMQKKTPDELCKLMRISDKIAQLNVARYQQWQAKLTGDSIPAIMIFQGDVYQGLDASSLTEAQLNYCQNNLRIISGLYGLLRPFDAIYPYRLEMGSSLQNKHGKNLYAFWSNTITTHLTQHLEKTQQSTVVNLASVEYASAINMKQLPARVIQPVFKDYKNGAYKTISFFAKKARGLMARYMAINEVNKAEELMNFNLNGYGYNKSMSTADNLVFTRRLQS